MFLHENGVNDPINQEALHTFPAINLEGALLLHSEQEPDV